VSESSNRREVLKVALALGATVPGLKVADAAEDPAQEKPQLGDQFVYFSGDKKGQLVKPDDLPLGGPQVMVWPMNPKTKLVRDKTRLNQVLLIRLDPSTLDQETTANGAKDGVVAYTAICTHQGCPVSMWNKEAGTLFCACHSSQYKPEDHGKVVAGPAPRRLPMLPIKLDGGQIVVAGAFTGRVGGERG
jgi:rieske iron-sulfur protein